MSMWGTKDDSSPKKKKKVLQPLSQLFILGMYSLEVTKILKGWKKNSLIKHTL